MPTTNKKSLFRTEALKHKEQEYDGAVLIVKPLSALYILLLFAAVSGVSLFILLSITSNKSDLLVLDRQLTGLRPLIQVIKC